MAWDTWPQQKAGGVGGISAIRHTPEEQFVQTKVAQLACLVTIAYIHRQRTGNDNDIALIFTPCHNSALSFEKETL